MGIKFSVTLSQASITFLFFSGFGLGVAITTVALIGGQIPLKCFDTGNSADWTAAIGTWVIGAIATVIAVQSAKNARKREDERARNEDRMRAGHLIAARSLMVDPSTVALVMRRFLQRPASERTWRRMRISMESALMSVQHVNFSSEMFSHLPHEAIRTYVNACHSMRAVRYMFDTPAVFSPSDVDDDAVVSAGLIQGWERTLEFASMVETKCNRFLELIDAEIHD